MASDDHSAERRHRHAHDSERRHHSREEERDARDSKRSRHRRDKSDEGGSHRSERHRSDRHRSDRHERSERSETKHRESTAAARLAAAEANFYSAQDNPFHDANLEQKFVWGKKREKEKRMGITPEEAAAREAARKAESARELELLNERRTAREIEQKEREAEQMRARREAESAHMAEWLAKEDDFHLLQAKRRAVIRIRERRAKPIDYLALNLRWVRPPSEVHEIFSEEDMEDTTNLDVDVEEPDSIFDNLSLDEARELQGDIEMYLSLEKDGLSIEFWEALLIVSHATIEALEQRRNGTGTERAEVKEGASTGVSASAGVRTPGEGKDEAGAVADSEKDIENETTREESAGPRSTGRGVSAAVLKEIHAMLAPKSYAELSTLQRSIAARLRDPESADTSYWENVLRELLVYKARARLREIHQEILANRLEELKRQHHSEAHDTAKAVRGELASYEQQTRAARAAAVAAAESAENAAGNASAKERQMYDFLRSLDDRDEIEESDDDDYELKESTNIYDMAELLGETELSVPGDTGYSEKYRPRKPRYFNKVITGFEWSKYNRTHYDKENPPPKVVRGYKFNIFYPDLIDRTKTPTYKISKNPDGETSTIVFSAGPPYEDIAFTIINKEWEHSHRRGFKSSFDRGILTLNFMFKRQFYRK